VAQGWHADVVATAKRDLKPGELLDGEGGTPSGASCCRRQSVAMGGLPLGLAHDVKVLRPVARASA
jgi:predicted homoserine dehydrogenase-like protein